MRHAPTLLLAAALLAPTASALAQRPASPDAAWRIADLPPGAPIAADEYAARRAALVRGMGDGVLLVFGEAEGPSAYPFLQSAPFRYLTGITEPDAALAVVKRGGTVTEMLFVRRRNPAREVWDGARLGTDRAATLTGIPSRTFEEVDAVVDSLLAGGGTLYTAAGRAEASTTRPLTAAEQRWQAVARRHGEMPRGALGSALSGLRGAKSARELDLIRRAVLITVAAQREAFRAIEPGMNEFEVQALIEGTFRRHGADGPSFGSIVGSGPNSTTLHYRAADRYMQAGEVVVMDIGASYRGYAADVTRTVPVNGRFSPEQRAIYQIVLEAQQAAEKEVRPGVAWTLPSAAAARVLAAGLARLGLIDAPDATYECRPGATCPQLRLFYMHGLGHGIGLDVHDPDVSFTGGFQPGSAFTIEPGIYVRGDVLQYLPDTPANQALRARLGPAIARYAGIGVRIEDDYVLTASGLERLSAGAPREIAEIEALMAQPSAWNATRQPEAVEWYRETTP